ncbi:PEP-CTERM sorting domain-containing protein [Colwellia psychrerythraea]|uniref:PEP motif putative anchor domain protein n=1 Tax=Colwellia psychrerythraea TaxID=28229 RepID=A0A099L494_COLPS|nr:PEP-CTERM sorting domain-containing protein [Colwellia psychrerythraea]KGJ97646.1 PEP motif putative anchor domain protein [Colwellia psychrerythraea]
MNNKLSKTLVTLTLSASCLINAANAGLITDANEITSTDPNYSLVTFDELTFTDGTLITDQFLPYGVSFSPNLGYETTRPDFTGFSGNNLQNFNNNLPFDIMFAENVNAFGAFWETNINQVLSFTAFLDGVELATVSSSTNDNCCSSASFLGFNGMTFDKISVSGAGANGHLIMDNLHFSATDVPEPATVALFGLALMGLATRKYKK